MGLFKILSRRYGKDKPEKLHKVSSLQSARAPSLDVTTASSNPAAPLSNSGARQSTASLGRPTREHTTEAPPMPPFFRDPHINERPESAESCQSGGSNVARAQRPKREPRRPPVSFRKPSVLSLTHSVNEENVSDAASSAESRSRSGSTSSVTQRRSMDLLDAADELKPLDFRSRVQATGARDYGEDVADRNILQTEVPSTPGMGTQSGRDSPASGQPGLSGSPRPRSRSSPVNTVGGQHEALVHDTISSVMLRDAVSFSRKNTMRLSLNTYKPTGFISPASVSPRSAATTPGPRGGMTARSFESPNISSLRFHTETWSRRYRGSPSGSNFSVPRSPKPKRLHLVENEPPLEPLDVKTFVDKQNLGDGVTPIHSSQGRSGAVGSPLSATAVARLSHGTYRSSMASSVTSRYPSMEFQALDYPKCQRRLSANLGELSNVDDTPDPGERVEPLPSDRLSRPNSEEGCHSRPRTTSSLASPLGLEIHPVNMDERKHTLGSSSSIHDWAVFASSNESVSSLSNGLYSSSCGNGGAASPHTKATSIDSNPRPTSSQRYSASLGQSPSCASGWSHTTTPSTAFNIDDYISSEDDSLTEKRPSGEDEEDLLFKDGFGVTGAALPGLLESTTMDLCPPPVPRYRAGQVTQPPEMMEDGTGDDYRAAESPDIDDNRLGEVRQVPSRQLRHAQSSPDDDLFGTFGRRVTRPRVNDSKKSPSWLLSDDWAHSTQMKRPTVLPTINRGLYSDEDADPPRRGQQRLSALGTPGGRTIKSTVSLDNLRRPTNRMVERSQLTNTIKEEHDVVDAARLRKDVKARKREDEARILRAKRAAKAGDEAADEFIENRVQEKQIPRACGAPDEEVLARAQALLEEVDRGRARVRGGKRRASGGVYTLSSLVGAP